LSGSPGNAPIVDLYNLSELPDLPVQEVRPSVPKSQKGEVLAFQNLSAVIAQPTPTPRLIPTPTPKVLPTATPKLPITPQPRPTPTPTPQRESVPSEENVAALEIPRRPSVIQPDALQENPWSGVQKEQLQDASRPSSGTGTPGTGVSGPGGPGTGSGQRPGTFSSHFSWGTPMTFETDSAFPYPEYLDHLKKKIEWLWLPEGTGTVSLYLIIDKNGKILKSGVDKGSGIGVEKLRESVIRRIALIQRFDPLPEEYEGTTLSVRITVRK